MADDAHFRLRIPSDLHKYLVEEAAKNHRSINAEIVARLYNSKEWHPFDPGQMAMDIELLRQQYDRVLMEMALLRRQQGK
jgi:hypothetical protein